MEFVLLIIGFVLLIKGADFFVDGSSNIAKFFKIPTLIIGLTVVAFGTSAPEAAVSIMASISNSNEIAVGNVLGSNIFNLLIVAGVSAIIFPMKVSKNIIKKDFLFSLLSFVVLAILTFDFLINGASSANILSRSDGLILLSFFIVYLYTLILGALEEKKKNIEKHKLEVKDILFLIIGLIAVIYGGNLVVNSASKIAHNIGLSETLIGLTVVSIGTSLPELVTSIVAAKKGDVDMALGNIIGSNIMNVLFILGMSSAINPIPIVDESLIDLVLLMGFSTLIYIFALRDKKINKVEGIIMVSMYIIYTIYIIIR